MANSEDKKRPDERLEKSVNDRQEKQRDRSLEYLREDRQITRDELPPVYPTEEVDKE